MDLTEISEEYSDTDMPLMPANAAESHSLLGASDKSSVLSLDDTRAKWRCLKNVALSCFSVALVFSSFRTLQTLESSLNEIQGIGVLSLACLYGGIIISCFYATALVRWTGFKWAVVVNFCAHVLFVAAHFYPRPYLIVPSAALVGLTFGAFWVGQVQYIVTLAEHYGDYTDTSHEVAIHRFTGLFFMFFQSAYIWGNMISSIVFVPMDPDNINFTYLVNETCGVNFCNNPNETIPYAKVPSNSNVYTLVGTYLTLCVIGLVIQCVFVDRIEPIPETQVMSETVGDSVTALIKIHCNMCMVLIIPLLVFIGLEQALLFAEFTQAFVSCELGIGFVGYAMLTFGAVNTLSSFIVGQLEKCTGRILLFIVAVCLNLAMILVMMKWTQTEGKTGDWLLYLIPGIWAIADSIWQTITVSMIAVEFSHARDAALASFQLWTFIGISLEFAYSFYLCMKIKLDIVLALMFVGFALYLLMELVVRRRMKKPYIDLYAPVIE